MMVFKLEGLSYIELIKLLKFMRLADSGGHAKILVESGVVKLNGIVEFRKRAKLRIGDIIDFNDKKISIEG